MKLNWIKRRGDGWCRLNKLDLKKVPNYDGVYVIWHDGILDEEQCVYVGQGFIRDRLKHHRSNDDLQFYAAIETTLYITWASVPAKCKNGVERYLADQLCPLEGERHPDVRPIAVNLPF